MRRTLCSLSTLLLLSFAPLPAARTYQPVFGDPLLEPWRWRGFSELSGLDAQCFAVGPDGTLWFGTADGLASYNGLEWIRHVADNNTPLAGWVSGLCFDPDGTVVAGGWWGISQLKNGQWTRLLPAVGVRSPDVRDLAATPDGTVWAATSWGALRRQQSTWTLFTDAATAHRVKSDPKYQALAVELLPEPILARPRGNQSPARRIDLTRVSTDSRGVVWLGTKEGEILRYTPPSATTTAPSWTLFNEADGLPKGRVPAILPAADGTVWVAHSSNEQVSFFDGTAWRALPLPSPGTGPDGARLFQTRDGVLWVSAKYVLFAWREGRWHKYEAPEVALPQATNLVAQSADGALWLCGPNTITQRIDYQTPRWTTLHDLNFQWESSAGVQWFLHRDGRVVQHDGGRWTSWGAEDGLIDTPVALLGARDGVIWAAGSHEGVAATARLAGDRWTRDLHVNFSWGVDSRAVLESRDGSLWFGAAVDSSGPAHHRDGILQYRNGEWIHHHQPGRSPRHDGAELPATLLPASHRPEPIEKYSSLGESRDGRIWAGRNVLVFHDGTRWTEFPPSPEFRSGSIIEAMFTTREGDLWIGTRQYGALRYDGRTWRQFQDKHSLVANSVRSFAQTTDASLWIATDRGLHRFDGHSWMADVFPAQLAVPHDGGNLKAGASGQLWLNRHTVDWNRRGWSKARPVAPDAVFRAVCHQPQGDPPQTLLTSGLERLSQPGNLSVLWEGTAAWREPREARLQFSHRLDGGPWSQYTAAGGQAFFTLPPGRHRLEVRARDHEFNVDPTPAVLDFTVLPPVWRQAWFIGLMLLLATVIATQSLRVFLERGRLRHTNRLLAGEIEARRQTNEEIRRLNASLEQRVAERTAQLEATNRELEAFSYSVSHDLRAPLRSIDGFSRALQEDYPDQLDADGQDFLNRIRAASQRMGQLIDDLLQLSHVTRNEMRLAPVDLSALAAIVAESLRQAHPGRPIDFVIAPGLLAQGDARLLQLVLENLFGNAVKFSARQPAARIEFGRTPRGGAPAFFVRDNGAGFDLAAARKLFGAFQRFHTTAEFPGTGIGLATVQRIIHRHGGQIEAESRPGEGATFYFTLPPPPAP